MSRREPTILVLVDNLRGKACRRVIKAAAANDEWNMRRYAAINTYLEIQNRRKIRK